MPSKNAVVLIADQKLREPARWLYRTLERLNPRDDTDIVLISDRHFPELPSHLSIPASRLGIPKLNFPTSAQIPEASYWRLSVPALLRSTYKRVLYLDIDVLPVSAGLFDCFDFDMRGAAVAACQSPLYFKPSRRERGLVTDGKFRFSRYFNSGVLLIDTDAFEREHVSQRTFDAIEEHGGHLLHHDQTALNLALREEWADLSLSYNFWPAALGTGLKEKFPPLILHYHGASKPWHLLTPYSGQPLRRKLLRHLVKTASWELILQKFSVGETRRTFRPFSLPYISPENHELQRYLNDTPFIDRL